MYVFKDILTGDEMYTDALTVEEVKEPANVFVKIQSKLESVDCSINESLIGGNPSQEEQCEATEDTVIKDFDVVLRSELIKSGDYSKAGLKTLVRAYLKAILNKLETEELQKEFMEKSPAGALFLIKKAKNIVVYTGKSMDHDGGKAFAVYEDGAVCPYFLFFKDGLIKEKC
ncbi:translationally-controlled tumor protein homolog [Styela clava]